MYLKKRLGKYRNSEQQFNTCSPVSCIYWTFDVIISSAVFFHNACERTCPDFTLEYGKNVRAALLTLSFMKKRKKIATWTDQWHGSWWGRGLENQSGLKSLYPPLQTLFTRFDPTVQSRTKKPEPTPHLPPVGSVIPGATTRTHTHAHTQAHMRVTETGPSRQTGWEGRTQRQGCREKRKGLCKTGCWARSMEWLIYQGKLCLCNVCEQVAISSLSHCSQWFAN